MNFKEIILEQFVSLAFYSIQLYVLQFQWQKALTHYISNMLKVWRKLTKWTFMGTLHSPSPSWIDTPGSRIFMIFFLLNFVCV